MVGEWLNLLLPVSRECFFDEHFLFKIKLKKWFGFRKYPTCLQKLCFNNLTNLLLHSIPFSSKNKLSTLWTLFLHCYFQEIRHMFSWPEVAVLEFSFTIDKQLLTTWLLTNYLKCREGPGIYRDQGTGKKYAETWRALPWECSVYGSHCCISGLCHLLSYRRPLRGAHL